MRNRRGQQINGWVNLDKPRDISSAKAVAIVRRVFNAAKAGHGGTLDPLASGVLPIALGEATKTVPYIMNKSKTYEFVLVWGVETNTDDSYGEAIFQSDIRPTDENIDAALLNFHGLINQVPPNFSAIKIDGVKAYDLARKTDNIQKLPKLPPRQIRIESIKRLYSDEVCARFFVECGKGTYIRALARDLGRVLGSAAHVTELRRLSVGQFYADDAISLDFLNKLTHSAATFEYLQPVMKALDDIPALRISGNEAKRLRQGQKLPALSASAQQRFNLLITGATAIAILGQDPVALVTLKGGAVCPVRVLKT